MKILITGGAGYIGSILTGKLLREGYNVLVFDNIMHGDLRSLVPFFKNKNFDFFKGDIRNKLQLKEAILKCDIICHLAGIVGYPACSKDPVLSYEVNVQSVKNINHFRSKNQIILNAGTGSVYGNIINSSECCTEETEINPVSIYAIHKAEAENVLSQSENFASLRLATAFGLSTHSRHDLLINQFCYLAINEGKISLYESHFKRNFIHVHDIARAFLHLIVQFEKMKNEIYNCGDKKMNLKKIEVARTIKSYHDFYIKEDGADRDEDQRNYSMCFRKINEKGFQTEVSLEQGIEEMLKFYKAAR